MSQLVRIYPKGGTDYFVEADRANNRLILKEINSDGKRQAWEKRSINSNDFLLINNDGPCAIKRPNAQDQPLLPVHYEPQTSTEGLLWTAKPSNSDPNFSYIVTGQNCDGICWTVMNSDGTCSLNDVVGWSQIQESRKGQQLWAFKEL